MSKILSKLYTRVLKRMYLHLGIQCFHNWNYNGVMLDLSQALPPIKYAILCGEYERAETKACKIIIKSDDIVLELGSALGYIGLLCRLNCKAKRVFSVEANPETVKLLKKNYVNNNVVSDLIQVAIARHDGYIDLHFSEDFRYDSFYSNVSGEKKQRVKSQSFNTVYRNLPEVPNVLICDIEGAEEFIDWKSIPSNIERIVIELHPRILGAKVAYSILFDIIQTGYEIVFADGHVYALQRNHSSTK